MAPSKVTFVAATAAVSAGVAARAFVAPVGRAPSALEVTQRSTAQGLTGGAPAAEPQASGARAGFALLGAAAAATALSRRPSAQTSSSKRQLISLAAFENELGVQAPVGFFDPAGFAADGNADNFARRRQTEIKHGRIAMLAAMGYITPEITGKLPGYLSPSAGLKFEDVPNGLAAISKVPAAGWGQILAYMAFCETSQDQSPGTAAAAGDFGFKVLTSSDPAEKTKKLAAELANGRLAMMAIMGMFFQDGLTGSAWGDWALYTASPLR